MKSITASLMLIKGMPNGATVGDLKRILGGKPAFWASYVSNWHYNYPQAFCSPYRNMWLLELNDAILPSKVAELTRSISSKQLSGSRIEARLIGESDWSSMMQNFHDPVLNKSNTVNSLLLLNVPYWVDEEALKRLFAVYKLRGGGEGSMIIPPIEKVMIASSRVNMYVVRFECRQEMWKAYAELDGSVHEFYRSEPVLLRLEVCKQL